MYKSISVKEMFIIKISAIISEYNPIHNGHFYHIQKTKELTNCDALIVVMSGNFMQRGIPAVVDKWNRTKMALSCGADLVIELPTIYAMSSAEFFSHGAVSLLNNLKIVNFLSFGSEDGDLSLIQNIANILSNEPIEYKDYFKNYLSQGLPFTTSRSKALYDYIRNSSSQFNDLDTIEKTILGSNNILAIEYCKSLISNKSSINPITIKREGGSYNDHNLNNVFSSATSIRKFLQTNSDFMELKKHIPPAAFKILNNLYTSNYPFIFDDSMLPYIKYKVLTMPNSIKSIPEASEGLDNKILKELFNSNNYNDIVLNIKSKRYTYTRISRILSQYFIGFENFDIQSLRSSSPSYARILGFNDNGKNVLKLIKDSSNIDLITKLPKNPCPMLQLDIAATKAYSLINPLINHNDDYIKPICICK